VGETVFVTPQMGRDLCDESRRELNMIFSFEHMETDQFYVKWFKRRFHAGRFARTLSKWQNALEWNANYLENHDQPRSVSRFGDDGHYWVQSAKLLCTLLFTLRGTPYVYQGQEIGMTNFDFTKMEQIQDVESHNIYRMAKRLHFPKGLRWKMIQASSRDNARTPMQWNNGNNAGFTTGKPWLGVNSNYTEINMASQRNDPNSIRSYYKTMIALRAGNNVLKWGSFISVETGKSLFVYQRKLHDQTLTVLLNFSSRSVKAPYAGEVVISNYGTTAYNRELQPYEAVILKG
jgi:oligo-1,6-glucosidase